MIFMDMLLEMPKNQARSWLRDHRNIAANDVHLLRKPETAYQALFEGEKVHLSVDNGVCFNENDDKSVN